MELADPANTTDSVKHFFNKVRKNDKDFLNELCELNTVLKDTPLLPQSFTDVKIEGSKITGTDDSGDQVKMVKSK